jgi:hypothetical protein
MLPAGLFDECRDAAERAAERPSSRLGAVIVVLLWVAAAVLIFEMLSFDYS